ncbi:hypothetical protein [Streptomyces griseoluteus]|uniref:hypothetical protein n=1 Tax=Streptomyces griseoluteus TaxID=29306 RepID=UPI003816BCB6
MHDDEQDPRPGSVPNAFGNAIAWRWSREMPAGLRRRKGFVLLLYTLRAMASASGELRFQGGRPFRIQDLAAAATIREKDCRRFLEAARLAGLVAVVGQRRRGTPTLYALLVNSHPDWSAAEAYLKGTDRAAGKDAAPWQEPDGSGTRGPNPELGHPRPELGSEDAEEVRAPAAPTGSGRGGPTGSGTRGPNTPGGFHDGFHEGAGVGGQPQAACAPEDLEEPASGSEPPTLRPVPSPPGGRPAPSGRATSGSSQRPLLLPVRSPAEVSPEELAALRAAATPEEIRQAITELGSGQAMRVYGHRLVAPYLAALPDHETGT